MSDPITIRVDVSRAREAFRRAPEVMERNIERFLSRGAIEVARDARGRAPMAFSNLVNSIHFTRITALHYEVAPGMNYGRMVEEGTPPHFPNPDAVRPWVERVLGVRGKEARDKAFLVARAISRRGTRPQPFMRAAADANRSRLFELIGQGVDEGLKEAFRV